MFLVDSRAFFVKKLIKFSLVCEIQEFSFRLSRALLFYNFGCTDTTYFKHVVFVYRSSRHSGLLVPDILRNSFQKRVLK